MPPVAAVLLSLALTASLFAATPEYCAMGPDIFDPQGRAETLIAEALTAAQPGDKKVLLLFGANWCPWCRRLHTVFAKDPAVQARLRASFVLVFIDANTRHDRQRNAAVIERYGNPVQYGLPVFVVLDRDGRQLTTRETSSFAADTDAKVAARLLAFLNEWAK